MRQNLFEQSNSQLWEDFNSTVKKYNNRKDRRSAEIRDLPAQYRKICNHYALALQRQYSPALVNNLHSMVLQGHKILYTGNRFYLRYLLEFIIHVFPDTVRRYFRHFLIAAALFLVPAMTIGTVCYIKPGFINTVIPSQQVAMYESMYNPSNSRIGVSRDRSSDTNFMMFGFYIRNNISIGFRTFAGGILAGIGVIFFLVYNGITIGAVAGHITGIGFGSLFWQFVTGHIAFELTAIVISGTGGLILAEQFFSPKGYSRSDALKKKAPEALKLMMGGFILFILAAFVEAFWSSGSFPHPLKYAAGCICWIMVFIYFIFVGRNRRLIF